VPTHKPLLIAIATTLAASASLAAQEDSLLLQRWVGTHHNRPLFIDFYSDSMVVVNDRHVSRFTFTGDSVIVVGDTSFAIHYRFAMDPRQETWRLLVRTEEGNILTMSHQGPMARPLSGNWLGAPIRTPDRQIELRMNRPGQAWWRWSAGGSWTEGEWDRFHRMLTFTWLPDSATWQGIYDPAAGQILFDETVPESGVTILRRFFRRR
jgi:hypothetical protein